MSLGPPTRFSMFRVESALLRRDCLCAAAAEPFLPLSRLSVLPDLALETDGYDDGLQTAISDLNFLLAAFLVVLRSLACSRASRLLPARGSDSYLTPALRKCSFLS